MNKLTILDYYVEQNKNPNYVDEFQSTSDKKSGKTFWHINVNFRSLTSFIDTFNKFKKYDDKDRKDWDLYSNSEEKAKHWTVRMQQSKLFRKDEKQGVYKLTAKGYAFKDFVDMVNNPQFFFSRGEQWIIVYYFILNSYFNLKPNYLLKRVNEVYTDLIINGFSSSYLNSVFLELLKKEDGLTKEELFSLDAFWIISFYKDKDFLSLYKNSTTEEKRELFQYVIECSRKDKIIVKQKNDLISKKFMSSGQYSISTFVDDVKTLYVTYNVLSQDNSDCFSLANNICKIYSSFDLDIKNEKIIEFINIHKDVFDVIFNEAILNKNIDSDLNNELENQEEIIDSDPDESKVDDTTTKNQKQLRKTSQILKRMAKERTNNKCELETLNSCRYFTSKENGKNYLEIHHLVPFEFSNDFNSSLEIIDNYVALCPHCHRLLHFGVDRERKSVITYLYNQRCEGLKNKGIDISLKELLAYYDFDE
ncbi:MAG: HNH endonuclease signature motif containing protein [Candidatus Onthovivens sp.]|nr:HNH endonuclease signature motif containing protein [Candidatus Onthovivens sp.]